MTYLLVILGYLPLLHILWIIEGKELMLAVVVPYIFFTIPLLYPLWKESGERRELVQDLIDEARSSGYGALADAMHRFVVRHFTALVLTRFETF